jgi:hypothetical protein
MKAVLATLVSTVLGAYSPFPIPFSSTGAATPPVLPLAPLGIAYMEINGGGYVVGSSTFPSLGWLGEDGSYTRTVWTDTTATASYSSIQGISWEPDLTSDGVILVARVNPLTTASALTAIDASNWATLWTAEIGNGWAFDVDASSGDYIWVTEAKTGGVWVSSSSFSSSAANTFDWYNNSVLAPSSATSYGVAGVYAISSSDALVSIVEPGVYKPRFYCIDISASTPTFTPITLTGGNLDALNWGGALSLEAYQYGDNWVVSYVSSPNGVGTITLGGGVSDFCSTGATYALNNWNTSATDPTAYPILNGASFQAATYNCNLNITVALGTSFAGLPGQTGTAPANYGLYVAAGTLPFTISTGFVAGNDCRAAIPVTPGALGNIYDMACYLNGRVTNAYASPRGYGIWFSVNTTLLTGSYSFTTRTAATNFDNYILVFSECPTQCLNAPYNFDPYITGIDDSSGPSGGNQPDCSASSNSYCSQWTNDFTTNPYANIYILVSFYSSSVPYNGELHTNSFQVIPVADTPLNTPLGRPVQVCDPRLTYATSDTTPASGGTGTGSHSSGGSLLSVF